MERKYIYIIVIMLSITLVVSDYFINSSLESINSKENTSDSLGLSDPLIGGEYYSLEEVSNFSVVNVQDDTEKYEYTYTLKLNGAGGTYRYTKNSEEDYIVFTANGEASITLNSNESITIYDIPSNGNYTVTQSINNKYKTYVNNVETNIADGIITSENKIMFVNVLTYGGSDKVSESTSEKESENKETPETPEVSEKPVTTPAQKNPNTSDATYIVLLVLALSSIILLVSRKIKVKRFR